MVKSAPNKPNILINLLNAQDNPEKIPIVLIKWLLSMGRYIIIFVELIVLGAFIARFKFDADLATYKEQIDAQVPYLESLKTDEQLIRQTQKQLATIRQLKKDGKDYALVFKKIADQTPQKIILANVTIENNKGHLELKLSGQATNNNELRAMIAGLKNDGSFTNINIASIGLDKGVIKFSLTGSINIGSPNEEQTQNVSSKGT